MSTYILSDIHGDIDAFEKMLKEIDYRAEKDFLIINGAVLVPGTLSEKDDIVKARLKKVFPDRDVVLLDCRPLLSGHGGLHCVTMQFPEGWMR